MCAMNVPWMKVVRGILPGVLMLLCASIALGQNVLYGEVVDAASGEKLPFASILVLGRTATGAVADSAGRFEVAHETYFPQTSVRLKVSCIGYSDTLVSVPLPIRGMVQVGLARYPSELSVVQVVAARFAVQRSIGVVSRQRKFKLHKERIGFGKEGEMGTGLYFGHSDKGAIIIDSIEFHILEWSGGKPSYAIQVKECVADPINYFAIRNFPFGKELLTSAYVFQPANPGRHTIRFTDQQVVSRGRGVFVMLSDLPDEATGTYSGFMDLAWYKAQGDHPFAGYWLRHEEDVLMLLNKRAGLGSSFSKVYPGIKVYYRSAR